MSGTKQTNAIRISLLIMLLLLGTLLTAEEISGMEVMEKVYNRPTGEDQTAEVTMTLINRRGNQRERIIKQYQKDFGDVDKKIMFFIAPADVHNTSFMNWSYTQEGKNDDQWLYLPALKRVRRISSDSRSDYFMGSDFTYDDLGERHPSEDEHTILREEEYDGKMCYVIRSIPQHDYVYSKTISWVVKDSWLGKKKEFYDRDGELLKILEVQRVENIQGYHIITKSEMHNVQSDHQTIMELNNVELDTGIDDSTFSERMMRRGL
jgi:outer membrane lipoprotein-sorting protein